MKLRLIVIGLLGAVALLPAVARADCWDQQAMISAVDNGVAYVYGAMINVGCYEARYDIQAQYFIGQVMATMSAPCSSFAGGCAERDELIEDLSVIAGHCIERRDYYGGL